MIWNQIKTVLLLGILTGLMLAIGSFWGKTGLLIALIIAVLINFGALFFSHKIVLAMYKAKEVKESEKPKLYAMVRELTRRAELPMPKIYLIESANPNAFATGPTHKKGVIAFTTGILNLLSEEELKGVAAHELSHIKNRDTLVSTIAATIAGVISYIATAAQWMALFGGMGGDNDDNKGGIIGLLVLVIITPIIATLIQLAISRSREYLADASGAQLVKTGRPLADALHKLEHGSKEHPIEDKGNLAANNLFIVNPLSAENIFALLSTHPPTTERIKRLKAMRF